ncbi:MAG: acyl-ACP--UDP-N-acetylglucosamine O-acyltransferase [Verrucomicrobiota bacterium]|nr:acyl-ACP--UDP-N-acetylglucosamine O-acyltransferase [Verrucomicrobiota bacterium]
MIHPTAIIHPQATISTDCQIGPYVVIDAHVSMDTGCRVGPHVYLTGHTTIGKNNRFHAGCVIGDEPQDLKYSGANTRLIIGNENIFREHVTVQRSNQLAEHTEVGSNNLLMANAHVGHNTRVGNHVIIANGVLLAGHVTVEDRVFISGNCLVHQFVRIGTLALMQGGAAISKDLPPFTIARGDNSICGLNSIGLRRAGLSSAERLELRRLYQALFRRGVSPRKACETLKFNDPGKYGAHLLDFINSSKRGVCVDVSKRRHLDEPLAEA